MQARNGRRFAPVRGGRCGAGLAALLLLAGGAAGGAAAAGGPEAAAQLTGVPGPGTHHYRLTTEVVAIAPDGQRQRPDLFDVWIEYTLLPDGDVTVTCRRFAFRAGDSPPVVLPALKDWSYRTRLTPTGLDERGWIFGIDQAKFAGLADERGAVLPQGAAYCVFNAFVDFHSFSEVFVRRTDGGGIQDLQRVGQRIVHAASHREAPISLGDFVAQGSTFRLGEVTLDLKGTSEVDGRPCALVGYDSGDASLAMTLQPAPQVRLEVRGSSHFFGDLYVDLATQAVRRATLTEFVVQETSGAVLPQKIALVIERKLALRDLSREEFARGLGAGLPGDGGGP